MYWVPVGTFFKAFGLTYQERCCCCQGDLDCVVQGFVESRWLVLNCAKLRFTGVVYQILFL